MNYKVVEVNSDRITDLQLKHLEAFCIEAIKENKHEARQNMQLENWELNNKSLLYLLLIERRFLFDKGGLLLLYEDQKIVATSGYYQADFDQGVYLMGVRSWVLKEYRFNLLVAMYLLPEQLKQIQKRGGHSAVISFNESTRSFAKLIERSNKNPEMKLKFFFGEKYPEIYKDMVLWERPVKIKSVKQWILIKKLSENTFDWNTLNWTE